MNIRTVSLSFALAACLLPSAASAGSPTTTGALPTSANRIVGTWRGLGNVSGAACTPATNAPAITSNVYVVYHAGGTITELPRMPTNASQAARTFGIGNWYYDPETDTYYASFRFDWYANGVLTGYQIVEREFKLDASGNHQTGDVVSSRYLDNGVEIAAQCGTGNATRL